MPFEYQLQQLCERAVVPTAGLSELDRWRLNTATRIVENNNFRLAEYVDGDLVTNPIYICREEAHEETGFDVLRLLHNYLASLYSYNETVRVLFNEYAPEGTTLSSGAFTPASGGTDDTHYGRKLSFLRGLRTDFQHGGFSCLRFPKVGTLHGFGAYHVEFDRGRFVAEGGLVDPGRYLAHTNERERRRPLSFVGQFHRNAFQSFAADAAAWFDAVAG